MARSAIRSSSCEGLLPPKLGHHLIVANVDKDGLLYQPAQLLPLSLEVELRLGHGSRAASGARVVRIKLGFRVWPELGK